MSLLDDVSIVVTPNGYKAGTLYGVLPVPTEGSEEITNGDFATDSNWSKGTGWSIANGKATHAAGVSSYINQLNVTTVGQLYKAVFTLSGSLNATNYIQTYGSSAYPDVSNQYTSAGTYTLYFTADATFFRFRAVAPDNDVSIENVSVKEYTASDMDVTRATAATRVDENGLVNYAEVLSSEYVKNGDFSNGLTDWSFTGASSGFQQDTGSGIKMYSGSVADANNALSTSATLNFAGTLGNMYKMEITASDFINGTTGSIRLDSVYDASNIISFSEGTQTVYFTAYRDFTFIQFFAGTSDATITVNSISIKEADRNNVPRIDYTGGGCPHILAEPQRTNTVIYSEDFSQYDTGGSTAPTLTTGQLAPDGTFTATKVSGVIGNTSIFARDESSTTASRSIYARTVSGTGTAKLMSYHGNTNNTFTITEEWQRFELTGAIATGGTNFYAIDFRDYSTTLSELIIWGGQSEEATYPTSYIPTSGSTVTRNKDQFTRDGIGSLINSTEGVLFAEMAALDNDLTTRMISLSDGGNSNRIHMFYHSVSNEIAVNYRVSGTTEASIGFVVSNITNFNKIAFKWKSGDFALWINGVEVGTDSNTTMLPADTLNKLAFEQGNGGNNLYAKVKQLQVYNTALTDMQLIQLTGTAGTDFYESYSEMAESLTYTIQ